MAEKKKMMDEATDGISAAELLADAAEAPEDVAEELETGEVIEGDAIVSGLIVLREKVQPKDKQKKPYFVYRVNGVLRGVEVSVDLVPPDRGGYKVLGIVFNEANALPLLMVPYEIVDEKTHRKTTGFTYKVMDVDQEGIVYECKLKPAADSSKRMLECLLQIEQKKAGTQ